MVSPQSQLIDTLQPASAQPHSLGLNPGESYFDRKWTLAEYEEELKRPIDYPDKHNVDDPRYYRKYAHNIPPL